MEAAAAEEAVERPGTPPPTNTSSPTRTFRPAVTPTTINGGSTLYTTPRKLNSPRGGDQTSKGADSLFFEVQRSLPTLKMTGAQFNNYVLEVDREKYLIILRKNDRKRQIPAQHIYKLELSTSNDRILSITWNKGRDAAQVYLRRDTQFDLITFS